MSIEKPIETLRRALFGLHVDINNSIFNIKILRDLVPFPGMDHNYMYVYHYIVTMGLVTMGMDTYLVQCLCPEF